MGSEQSKDRDTLRRTPLRASMLNFQDTTGRTPQPYSYTYDGIRAASNVSPGYTPQATSSSSSSSHASPSQAPLQPPPRRVSSSPAARIVPSSLNRPPDLPRPLQPVPVEKSPLTMLNTRDDIRKKMSDMSLSSNRGATSSSSTFSNESKNPMGAACQIFKQDLRPTASSSSGDTQKATSNGSKPIIKTATTAGATNASSVPIVSSSLNRPPDLPRPPQQKPVEKSPLAFLNTRNDMRNKMSDMSLSSNGGATGSSITFGSEFKNSMGAAFQISKQDSKPTASSSGDTQKATSNGSKTKKKTATAAAATDASSVSHVHVKSRTVRPSKPENHQRKSGQNTNENDKIEASSRQQKGPLGKVSGQTDHEKKHVAKDKSHTIAKRNFHANRVHHGPRSHNGNHGPPDIKFAGLSYPYIYLEQFGTVARSLAAAKNLENVEPIVYLDKPLTNGHQYIFNIEETNDASNKSHIVMVVGLTTCGPSKLREYFYHVNESCKNGELDCGGYSLSLPIYSGDSQAQSVRLEKLEKGSLARLTTYFADESQPKSRAIKDLTNGRMSSQPLFPFLVLSGLVSKVRVRSEATFKKLPLVVKPAATPAATLKIASTDPWVSSKGIEISKQSFRRQSDGQFYAVCKERLAPGQEYCFTISRINESVTGETLTLGFTTIDPSSLELDTLPQPMQLSSKAWKVFNNVLPAVALNDVIKISITTAGISIESPTVASRPLMRNVPPRAHLFIYMTAKILKIKFPQLAEAKETTVKKKPKEPTAKDQGICCVCLDKRSDTIMLPCKHACVCSDCAHQVIHDDRRCPICRARVESSMTIFIT